MNTDLESIGFADPCGQFTMISANLLVLVTIDELMKDNTRPESWEDLLKDEFRNRVIMRGQDGFFSAMEYCSLFTGCTVWRELKSLLLQYIRDSIHPRWLK